MKISFLITFCCKTNHQMNERVNPLSAFVSVHAGPSVQKYPDRIPQRQEGDIVIFYGKTINFY